MRTHIIIAAIGAVALGSSAALAQWHSPYVHREQNGDWMRYEYNDGICYYSYERNGFNQRPYTTSSGDCSHANIEPPESAPVYVVPEDLAEKVTGFHVHRGALASLRRRPLPGVEEVVAGARSILVLEDVVDHANVGAIFRSGAALGFDAVLVAPRCADPLYRRSIKVAMGAVFTLPWTRLPDWYDALPSLAASGFTTVALTLSDDAVPIEQAVAGIDRLALVLGSEGHGLSSRWEQTADRRAIIPMAAGIDSLNVAAASAVACYVAARR